MDLVQAQKIVDYWNGTDVPGRVKTQQVIEAEKYIEGAFRRSTTSISERGLKLLEQRHNENIRKNRTAYKRRIAKAKPVRSHIGNHHDDNWAPYILASGDLDFISCKRFRIITEVVLTQSRVSFKEVFGMTRKPEIVAERFIIIYLATLFELGMIKELSRFIRLPEFRAMNHATIINAQERIGLAIQEDANLRNRITGLIDEVKAQLACDYSYKIKINKWRLRQYNFNNFDL